MTEEIDVISVTHDLKYAVRDAKCPEGLLTAIVPQSGAALVIMPQIEDAVSELKAAIDVFGGEAGEAEDKLKRMRGIGPIVQSAILGRTVHIPIQEAELTVDPYDEVLLLDFDRKAGRRELVIQIISEAPPEDKQQRQQRPQRR